MTMQHTQQVQALNAHQARAQFLGKSADLDFCFKLSAFSTDKYCGITTRVFIIIVYFAKIFIIFQAINHVLKYFQKLDFEGKKRYLPWCSKNIFIFSAKKKAI